MNSIAEFKRRLQVGVKLATIMHKANFAGRDENDKAVYTPKEIPEREVSIVQSNSFALKTIKTTGEVVDSWCMYPKKAETEFNGNEVIIYETDRDGTRAPILTYKFI